MILLEASILNVFYSQGHVTHFSNQIKAIATLQHVIASDFKPTDIEVAIVGEGLKFQSMENTEIEEKS